MIESRPMIAALSKKRWQVLAGGFLMDLAFGNVYGWSVFVAPLEAQFGWKRADTSLVFTIAVFMTGFTFLLSGWIYDRVGPTPCALSGGVLASLGFFLSAYTHSLLYLYICFGFIGGLGSGLGCAVIIPVIAKWFPDKRGLAIGLIIGAYGASSAIFAPLAAQVLIPNYGLAKTFQILGIAFLVMTIGGAFWLKNPPSDWQPESKSAIQRARSGGSTRQFAPMEVLRTPAFYFLWLGYALGCSAGMMIISQLVPLARSQGIPNSSIAIMGIVVGAIGNILGRILSGWLSDKVGRINVLRLAVAVSAVTMPLLFEAGSAPLLLYLSLIVIYYCYGTQLSVNTAACADFWGVRCAGLNNGLLWTAWGVAGIIGPYLAGRLFDKYHNYQYALYIASMLAFLALACEFLVKRPTDQQSTAIGEAELIKSEA